MAGIADFRLPIADWQERKLPHLLFQSTIGNQQWAIVTRRIWVTKY